MTTVIVAHEKHGVVTYHSALDLLQERLEEGFWYYNPDTETHPFSLDLRAKRDALLEAAEREPTVKETSDYKRALENKTDDDRARKFLSRARAVVAARDENAAWRLLCSRRDAEYEYVEKQEVR